MLANIISKWNNHDRKNAKIIIVKWKLLQKDIFDAFKYFGGIDVKNNVCIVDILDDHDVVKLARLLAGLESLGTSKGWATCSFRYYKGRLYELCFRFNNFNYMPIWQLTIDQWFIESDEW